MNRWNTENKLLFGSIHKTTAGRSSRVDGAVAPRAGAVAGKARQPEGSTEHRLQEMASISVGMNAVGSTQANEGKHDHKSVAVGTTKKRIIRQDFHSQSQILWQDKLHEGGKLSEHEQDVFPSCHSQNNDVEIPKILSIPKGKNPNGIIKEKAVTSVSSSKKVSVPRAKQPGKLQATEGGKSTTSSQPKEADFVLQCPLFPDQLQVMPTAAQEFHSMVESFGLRFLPTVNMVLNKTRPALGNMFQQRWREKMIKELGDAGFKKHQEGEIVYGHGL